MSPAHRELLDRANRARHVGLDSLADDLMRRLLTLATANGSQSSEPRC